MNNSRSLPLPIALESVFENSVLGSTGHWPVPSGESPENGSYSRALGMAFRSVAHRSPGRRVADRGGRVAHRGGRVVHTTHFQNPISGNPAGKKALGFAASKRGF